VNFLGFWYLNICSIIARILGDTSCALAFFSILPILSLFFFFFFNYLFVIYYYTVLFSQSLVLPKEAMRRRRRNFDGLD